MNPLDIENEIHHKVALLTAQINRLTDEKAKLNQDGQGQIQAKQAPVGEFTKSLRVWQKYHTYNLPFDNHNPILEACNRLDAQQHEIDRLNSTEFVSYCRQLLKDCERLTIEKDAQQQQIDSWHNLVDLRSREICRLTAENKAQAEQIEKLEAAVKEGLSICKGQWQQVNNHPASSWARDVAYFEQALKGEKDKQKK